MLGASVDKQALRISEPVRPDRNSADILLSLDTILETPTFRSSPQLSSFLLHVVREELAGRGDLIKAYTVAVDGLGRPESFDPSKDPSIRVLATRLRRTLNTVYERGDLDVSVRIRLIKGSYRPRFEPFQPTRAPPEETDIGLQKGATAERTFGGGPPRNPRNGRESSGEQR